MGKKKKEGKGLAVVTQGGNGMERPWKRSEVVYVAPGESPRCPAATCGSFRSRNVFTRRLSSGGRILFQTCRGCGGFYRALERRVDERPGPAREVVGKE